MTLYYSPNYRFNFKTKHDESCWYDWYETTNKHVLITHYKFINGLVDKPFSTVYVFTKLFKYTSVVFIDECPKSF